jgi:repressor LexA
MQVSQNLNQNISQNTNVPIQPLPGEPSKQISPKRAQILEYINDFLARKGYPPSVREIGEAVGLNSPASVQSHLNKLKELGLLSRVANKTRAISLSDHASNKVPLLGAISAGYGSLAQENIEDYIEVPSNLLNRGKLFALRVKGDSMAGDAIIENDIVIARAQNTATNGDIVVAGLRDEEATIKRFIQNQNRITLKPSNPNYEPIILEANEVTIYGKVISLLRCLS